jgi:hypothetical protein
VLRRRPEQVSAAFSGITVKQWTTFVALGAYVLDSTLGFGGYLLAAVWFLVCLPVIVIAFLWAVKHWRQLR